jgi:hypothetical protein
LRTSKRVWKPPYWHGKASSEHEAARIDAAFEEQLAEGPDFTRYHRDSMAPPLRKREPFIRCGPRAEPQTIR